MRVPFSVLSFFCAWHLVCAKFLLGGSCDVNLKDPVALDARIKKVTENNEFKQVGQASLGALGAKELYEITALLWFVPDVGPFHSDRSRWGA